MLNGKNTIWLAAIVLLLVAAQPASAAVQVYGYTIKNVYPHDVNAFTEGLLIKDGFLYESTGLKGKSTISKLELKTGKVLKKIDVAPEYFGEGITIFGNELFALTWQNKIGFVYDATTFKQKKSFSYSGEGWALTNDKENLYMSDGTANIRVLNPKTLQEILRIHVTLDGRDVDRLNELEWVEGEIYANVWGLNQIVRINPSSGQIVGIIDLTGIIDTKWFGVDDVLNGIAYDSKTRRLFVTGKHWPSLFEIELVERKK